MRGVPVSMEELQRVIPEAYHMLRVIPFTVKNVVLKGKLLYLVAELPRKKRLPSTLHGICDVLSVNLLS